MTLKRDRVRTGNRDSTFATGAVFCQLKNGELFKLSNGEMCIVILTEL